MSTHKIPPIKGKLFKENFIQNFFDKLFDMKLAVNSDVLKTFLNDLKFKEAKKKEIKNVQNTVD
jgi:hypothetical protein